MENREIPDRMYPVHLVIEGNEDTSVRPRKGPRPEWVRSAGVVPPGLSLEPVHVLIANHEELQVRPRRRGVVPPGENGTGSGSA